MALRTVLMPEMLLHLKFNYGPYFYLLMPDKTFGCLWESYTSKVTSAKETQTSKDILSSRFEIALKTFLQLEL